MTPNTYVVGRVYFRVTYPDVKMHFPLIESFVFIGKNFSDEDVEDTWYFQSAEDFSDNGSALDGIERPVSCATIDDLGDFEDVSKLSTTLMDADARRIAAKKRS
jgi:hypothetical protein